MPKEQPDPYQSWTNATKLAGCGNFLKLNTTFENEHEVFQIHQHDGEETTGETQQPLNSEFLKQPLFLPEKKSKLSSLLTHFHFQVILTMSITLYPCIVLFPNPLVFYCFCPPKLYFLLEFFIWLFFCFSLFVFTFDGGKYKLYRGTWR